MESAGFGRAQQFWAAVLTSAPQPVGAVIAYLAVEQVTGLLPVSFAFAAGAMLALVVVELVPQALAPGGRRRRWPGSLGGRGRDGSSWRRCSASSSARRARGGTGRAPSATTFSPASQAGSSSTSESTAAPSSQPGLEVDAAPLTGDQRAAQHGLEAARGS